MSSLEVCLIIPLIIFLALSLVYRSIFKQQTAQIKQMNADYHKLAGQKKSSEVRLGQIGEHFAPLLDVFPYDPKNARFLGSPIDFVVFDYDNDQIVLVEFKTGESRESNRQKVVREMVAKGNVKYEVIRIKSNGEA